MSFVYQASLDKSAPKTDFSLVESFPNCYLVKSDIFKCKVYAVENAVFSFDIFKMKCNS